ncbi:hypothetical protein ElyMa_000841400 [Elysia marginata]|uniref:Uncharacterized protein n=1 Tax=Elysia marginata TaxID=1093978 RepID=A0AAV4H1V7_9GAST|nr:hypothetical protein ElyMa_000841400 [Elysia marginata]
MARPSRMTAVEAQKLLQDNIDQSSSSSNSDSDSDYNPDETVDTLVDVSTIADSEPPVPDTVIPMIPASLDTEQAPCGTSIIVELPSSFNTNSVPEKVCDTAAHDTVLEQHATHKAER